MGTLLIVIGLLACLLAGVFGAFAWHARRIVSSSLREHRVAGDAGRAPLSGEASAWWRVRIAGGGERCSSQTLTFADGDELSALAVDPHPDEVRRFACLTDPLADPENANPRELYYGEVADTPYTAEEYSLAPGAHVTVGHNLFAAAGAADIAANARRASIQMTRLATVVAAGGLVAVVAGVLLR